MRRFIRWCRAVIALGREPKAPEFFVYRTNVGPVTREFIRTIDEGLDSLHHERRRRRSS